MALAADAGAMTVADVATWIGLLTGVTSVVLAVVAIWFSLATQRRAETVNMQTIQSLQKIESTVERLSDDTQDLIKAAWDKMLSDLPNSVVPPESSHDVAAIATGVAAELRAELLAAQRDQSRQPGDMKPEQLNDAASTLARALQGQISLSSVGGTASGTLDYLVSAYRRFSPEAGGISRVLTEGRPLRRSEYVCLRNDTDMAIALRELREAGILAPVEPPDGSEGPVYAISPRVEALIPVALSLAGRDDPAAYRRIVEALRRAGYDDALQAQ